MAERPEQSRTTRSTPMVLVACALAVGIAVGHAGVAGAESASNSSSSVDTEWEISWAAYQAEERLAGSLLETVEVTLPITIDAPLDHVFPVYSNLNSSLGRHPFLMDVLDHRSYTEDGADVREFIAIEGVPAGSASIPARTVGRQRVYAADDRYTTETWSAPGVITQQEITFSEEAGSTTVTEHLTFRAPALLIDFTVQNGVSSHIENQQAMQRDIENGTL
ncbi:hypothetical protein [Rhodococcus triatomae]|nr:hypothetical protein G419_23889 [Rhodococcus triatomae BKS 15-14]